MLWFWYFLIYSFIGFLLEVFFALCTGGHLQRKCLLILPLCPVYGLGACAILMVSPHISHPITLFFAGGILATACEYGMAYFYENILRVKFWDYEDIPFQLHGRVCLPFSLTWGALTIPLVVWLHPVLLSIPFSPPPPMLLAISAAFWGDFLTSSLLLYHTGSRDVLNWYHS